MKPKLEGLPEDYFLKVSEIIKEQSLNRIVCDDDKKYELIDLNKFKEK